MIRSVEIKGLRGIREGKLDEFTPLVVLVGPNGSGKSTILDAIMIGASPNPSEAVGQCVTRRVGLNRGGRWILHQAGAKGSANVTLVAGDSKRECVLSHGHAKDNNTNIEIRVTDDSNGRQSFETNTYFPGDGTYLTNRHATLLDGIADVRFVDPHYSTSGTPLHRLYTRVVENGRQDEVAAVVANLIPGVTGIQILTDGDDPVVYLVFKDHAIPAVLAGDGIRLLLQALFEFATRQGGVVLLEEPEVHLHPGAMRECVRVIWAAVRRGIQVFLTTHSLEFIDTILSESSDADLELMSLYSMQLEDGMLKHFRLPGRDVALSRTTLQDDLR